MLKTMIAIMAFSLLAGLTAAGSPLLAQAAGAPADWSGVIEKGSIITVLSALVLYLQKRNERNTEKLEKLAEASIAAQAEFAAAQRQVAESYKEMAGAIRDYREWQIEHNPRRVNLDR